jgi:hypothetical protein
MGDKNVVDFLIFIGSFYANKNIGDKELPKGKLLRGGILRENT